MTWKIKKTISCATAPRVYPSSSTRWMMRVGLKHLTCARISELDRSTSTAKQNKFETWRSTKWRGKELKEFLNFMQTHLPNQKHHFFHEFHLGFSLRENWFDMGHMVWSPDQPRWNLPRSGLGDWICWICGDTNLGVWLYHRKTMAKLRKTMGKPWINHGWSG